MFMAVLQNQSTSVTLIIYIQPPTYNKPKTSVQLLCQVKTKNEVNWSSGCKFTEYREREGQSRKTSTFQRCVFDLKDTRILYGPYQSEFQVRQWRSMADKQGLQTSRAETNSLTPLAYAFRGTHSGYETTPPNEIEVGKRIDRRYPYQNYTRSWARCKPAPPPQ